MDVPEASLWREYGLLLADSDFRKAERILMRALKAHSEDVEVIRALAAGLSRQGRWPEAADFYSQWLRVEPDRTDALMARTTRTSLRLTSIRRPNDERRNLTRVCSMLEQKLRVIEQRPEQVLGSQSPVTGWIGECRNSQVAFGRTGIARQCREEELFHDRAVVRA
jgi:tetratricopeptide (TPR) repeat protein